MTLEEFHERYRSELNLAQHFSMDTARSVGESFGLVAAPGEMHHDYLDRIADHVEQGKVRK